VEREAYLMGTILRVNLAAPSRAEAIQAIEDVFTAVRRVDAQLSTWRDDSEIAHLNQAPPGRPTPLSAELYRLLREAAHWTRATEGAFDPGIGPLIDAWDLRGKGRVPSQPALSAARSASGLKRFVFADGSRSVSRTHGSAWIDTGGFGKGVALREARRALRARGISSGILNFGGQVLVLGTSRSGGRWIVPVAHPVWRAEPVAKLHLQDRSASTTSQSERSVVADGRRVGHVLDPRSGQPVPAWGSITVVAEDPTVADAVSTALLVLGPEEGLRWARQRADVGVLFLLQRDGLLEQRWNDALEQYLVQDSTLLQGG
jgi:thiamine biosynthesis lipoprotein